ncbi:Protein of unknown function [Gryllus bimaculatus]|nr:Protein of unknown function [Gryllus bimaculatus]
MTKSSPLDRSSRRDWKEREECVSEDRSQVFTTQCHHEAIHEPVPAAVRLQPAGASTRYVSVLLHPL